MSRGENEPQNEHQDNKRQHHFHIQKSNIDF